MFHCQAQNFIVKNEAVKNLNITVNGDMCKANNIKDPVSKAIEKYKKRGSIKAGISKFI